MHRKAVGGSLLVALLLGITVNAPASELAEGHALYKKHCSLCHGLIGPDTAQHFDLPASHRHTQTGSERLPEITLTVASRRKSHGLSTAAASLIPSDHPKTVDCAGNCRKLWLLYSAIGNPQSPFGSIAPATSEEHLAFAPPYGPPLRGVYGRLAGSVTGFPYSRAFKETLQGVVWTRERLDVWIADSQAWVPGSRMFYQQPDAEIRRKIIMYLEANR
jgi:cytochrome c2